MKKIQTTILMLALAFLFANANAQKITLSTLEQLASGALNYDSAISKLGFRNIGDNIAEYALGKDSAEIWNRIDIFTKYKTNSISFETNNAALYKLIIGGAEKNGYDPPVEIKGDKGSHNYCKKKSGNITFRLSYDDKFGISVSSFKYQILLTYDLWFGY